jgi:Uma2 family endonuclease
MRRPAPNAAGLIAEQVMSVPTTEWLRRHRLTVDDYYRMAEAGVLAPDARVELIEGEIIDMAPIGSRHGGTVSFLLRQLTAAARQLALVTAQSPLRLDRSSEPQPDLMLLRPRADFYRKSHPTASDVLLLIEVSDGTLRYDGQVKVPLYARHGVPEVWLVDLTGNELHCLRSPQDGTYAHTTSFRAPGKVPLSMLDAVAVDLDGLFDS